MLIPTPNISLTPPFPFGIHKLCICKTESLCCTPETNTTL